MPSEKLYFAQGSQKKAAKKSLRQPTMRAEFSLLPAPISNSTERERHLTTGNTTSGAQFVAQPLVRAPSSTDVPVLLLNQPIGSYEKRFFVAGGGGGMVISQ